MPPEKIYHLSKEQRARVAELLAAELSAGAELAFAYLYGSFATGEAFHDVDVGVYLRPPPPKARTLRALDLAQQLTGKVRLPVDVRILNAAPVTFLYHVFRGRLLVSHDDDLVGKVVERTIAQYLDIAPLLRHYTKEAFGR
jgi:hypothetical protein